MKSLNVFKLKFSMIIKKWSLKKIQGKTTGEWHTNDIGVHTSDIRVTYGWHTRIYEWHTDYIRVHTNTYQLHTDNMRVHTNDIRVHTSGIQMTYERHMDVMWFERKIKLIFLKLFDNSLSKYLICKRIFCTRCLFWIIYQN